MASTLQGTRPPVFGRPHRQLGGTHGSCWGAGVTRRPRTGALKVVLTAQDVNITVGRAQASRGRGLHADGVVADLVEVQHARPYRRFGTVATQRDEDPRQRGDSAPVQTLDRGSHHRIGLRPGAHRHVKARVVIAFLDKVPHLRINGGQRLGRIARRASRWKEAGFDLPVREQLFEQVGTVAEVVVAPPRVTPRRRARWSIFTAAMPSSTSTSRALDSQTAAGIFGTMFAIFKAYSNESFHIQTTKNGSYELTIAGLTTSNHALMYFLLIAAASRPCSTSHACHSRHLRKALRFWSRVSWPASNSISSKLAWVAAT